MAKVNDYLHARAAAKRIPLQGTFELSPVCNFSCKMCYVRKTPAQIKAEGKRLLDWTEWLDMAKQCYAAGTLSLLLTGGEPFLYPGFRELYTALHKMGFVISINSNGTMIDEETVEWLKTMAPSRVNITLYGASRETYSRICGNADGFDRALNAIKMLKAAGIPVVINSSMIPENCCDLEKIMAIGADLELNVRMVTYMFPPSRREREESDSRFTPEQAAEMYMKKSKFRVSSEALKQAILDKQARQKERLAEWGENSQEFMACRAGRSSFWLSWDGVMSACGVMPFPRSEHPFEDGFADCWNRLTDAVRSTTVLGSCRNCPEREFCKPCVAMIYAETGDPNEKAPYLCRMAKCVRAEMERELEEITNGKEQSE